MPVRVNLKPLTRFYVEIDRAISGGSSSNPVRQSIRQWGEIYRQFAFERFDTFSKGGGDWAPLKPSTIRARRKGKGRKIRTAKSHGGADKRYKKQEVKKGSIAILANTGILKAGMEPTLNTGSGALEEFIKGGIRVGYGGQAKHEKSKATIAFIAAVHQTGNPKKNLPAREIIVEPPRDVVEDMAAATERAIALLWKQSTAG